MGRAAEQGFRSCRARPVGVRGVAVRASVDGHGRRLGSVDIPSLSQVPAGTGRWGGGLLIDAPSVVDSGRGTRCLHVSAEETAEAIGSTPGAVRVTQHRALLRLRRIIAHGASTATTADLDAGEPAAG